MIQMIIAFTGKKGSGKTTAAHALRDSKRFVVKSFASPLKSVVMKAFDFSMSQVHGDEKEEIDERYGVTPREVMQVFGTEIFQYDIHKHLPNLTIEKRKFWAENFKREVNDFKNEFIRSLKYDVVGIDLSTVSVNIVVDDLRFPHEAEVIREMGGIVIQIVRTGHKTNDSHASETEMEKIEPDYIFFNDMDSAKEFKHELVEWFEAIQG